jgi:hypothetical protein
MDTTYEFFRLQGPAKHRAWCTLRRWQSQPALLYKYQIRSLLFLTSSSFSLLLPIGGAAAVGVLALLSLYVCVCVRTYLFERLCVPQRITHSRKPLPSTFPLRQRTFVYRVEQRSGLFRRLPPHLFFFPFAFSRPYVPRIGKL